jgi:putative ABC transport system permease protein
LLSLVSKDFILLVGAAVLFAWPLSWWLVQQWLKRFVFRMDPGPGLFIGTALGTILIALVIVGLQTMKAARANPVKSLRTE